MLATSPEAQRKETTIKDTPPEISISESTVLEHKGNGHTLHSSDCKTDTIIDSKELIDENLNSNHSHLTDNEASVNSFDQIGDLTVDTVSDVFETSIDDTSVINDKEDFSESHVDHLDTSKLSTVALHSRSNSRNRSASQESLPPQSNIGHYEEFTSMEIDEAKLKATEPIIEHIPINPSRPVTPEPHSASPIKEILLALQKEATKYRNIQGHF